MRDVSQLYRGVRRDAWIFLLDYGRLMGDPTAGPNKLTKDFPLLAGPEVVRIIQAAFSRPANDEFEDLHTIRPE